MGNSWFVKIVNDGRPAMSQPLFLDEFFLLCQLSFDVANDEILHGDGSKRAET